MKLSLRSLFSSRDIDSDSPRACARPDCDRRLRSAIGMSVGEQWYCSVECFSLACHGVLGSLCAAEVIEVPRTPRLTLGLALLTKGYLTTDQFRHAIARQEEQGIDLERTVTELGWVTEKQLAAARAAQWGYPVLGQDLSAHSVVADLPADLFRACSATPLYYSAEAQRLVLGFVQRVDHSLLQSIEQITACRAEPCFITPSELARQLDRLTAPRRYQQNVIEQPGGIADMAATLAEQAHAAGATRASFTRCHSFLWTRLAGAKGITDTLFDLKHAQAASPLSYPAHFLKTLRA